MEGKVQIQCRTCIECGEAGTVEVDAGEFRQWQEGMYAQYAFPTMPASQSEMLISGTHPECWERMWRTNEVQSRPPRTI